MYIKIATLFGIGRIPRAPGTWGSLAALPLAWLFMQWGPVIYMILTFITIIVAIIAAERFERSSESHDAKEIVIDEVVGVLVTMTMLPSTWTFFLVGFLLFRLLDILKPFPISYFDRKVPGGFGVVADDLVAGMIANFALQFVLQVYL